MNLLLQDAMAPGLVRPHCYNRPPIRKTYSRFGLDSQTGEVIEVVLSNEWSIDRCTQHDGRGIGPNGESYAEANNFDCVGCRWKTEGTP